MTQIDTLTRLQSRKSALGQSRLESEALPLLQDGEITLQIRQFSVTTNNVTYLAFGEAPLHYWSYFPTGDAEWAQMPVWGFADVVESTVPGIDCGERIYGFFPIANVIRMRPQRISARGFFDAMPHRVPLIAAYNFYTRCSEDPAYSPDLENYQALLRPLFVTSWMLADYLEDHQYFGAKRLVVSSASSKTAFGTAAWISEHSDMEVVALTSARNREFVESLGCYTQTYAYDQLEEITRNQAVLYLDFSGDPEFRSRVHRHFGDALVHDCLVGSTQSRAMTTAMDSGLEGPAPKFFFAPEQIAKRISDWGAVGYNERFSAAERGYIAELSDPDNDWMNIVEHIGMQSAQSLIADLLAGRMDPRAGHIVRLGTGPG